MPTQPHTAAQPSVEGQGSPAKAMKKEARICCYFPKGYLTQLRSLGKYLIIKFVTIFGDIFATLQDDNHY